MEFTHIPVLLAEAVEALAVRPDGIYIDGTAGGAGHSREIAKRLTTGRLLAFDKDPDALETAARRLAEFPCAAVVESDFRNIPEQLDQLGIEQVDGILLDLGVSSRQLDAGERGFSYQVDAPLDMRMSQKGPTAAELVNTASAAELTRVLREYGEERYAARIAAAIVKARTTRPIATTLELSELIKSAIPAPARREGGHPAKRSFQALRIAVNDELGSLSECLERSFARLKVGGRFAVITFHSLEDRIVKQRFAALCRGCTCPPELPVCICGKTPLARLVTRKPVEPSPRELGENRRSHSARLRAIEKIQDEE